MYIQREDKNFLILMIGIPGSGKSTFAKQIFFEDAKTKAHHYPVILSSDEIRKEILGNEEDQTNNAHVFQVLRQRVVASLKQGEDVVVDATNITKRERATYIKLAKNLDNPPKILAAILDTEYIETLRRNNQRERVVPEDVIARMRKRYQKPTKEEGFDEIITVMN